MAESLFVRADEVIRLLGVSKSEAYRIIKRLNDEIDMHICSRLAKAIWLTN